MTSTAINPMNTKTRSLLQEIRRKVKNPITGTHEFPNDNSVIDLAVQNLHENLKRIRALQENISKTSDYR